MVEDDFSCVKELTKTVHIALPSSYITNEITGVTDILESWKRQYNHELQGIVVSYKNISLASKPGCLVSDQSCVHYYVKATFELFRPSTGSIVQGKINRVSHDYIGCLIHNTINVTIKRFSSILDGLSEFIALDRMILFKITHLGYHLNGIKVEGEITEECVTLMKELAPFNTQSTISNVKDNEEYSESLINSNCSFQTTNQGVFNVDHLADGASNDVSSTLHEGDSSEELSSDIEKKPEKHSLHKLSTPHCKEEIDIDGKISDLKLLKKIKKHKDKKSKDKSFITTQSPKKLTHSGHHKKPSSKEKKSKKNKILNDKSIDTASGIETFNDFKISLSPTKKKSSSSLLNSNELNEFSSPQQNAFNSIGILSSNNLSTDFSIKDGPIDSDFHSTPPKKKSKSSKNKSNQSHLSNNVTPTDIEELVNVFAAYEPNLGEQLHLNEISSSAIKKEPVEATKKEKKRKRESSDKDGLPSKKKKTEGDEDASGKSKKGKSKVLKKGKSKKKDKEKSVKNRKKSSKDKKPKSKKAQLSYKIKSKKNKKKKDQSRSKKLKKSKKDKAKDVP